MKLEICANSYQSAINAQKAGADRIELCSELGVGGITPSYGLLKKVAAQTTIPVHVLIRPRSGDFCYSNEEFEQMKIDIQLCKELNINGIVCGILHQDNTIDIERTRELVELSKPLSFTFHRAFDCVIDPKKALQQLIDLNVDRVLTSGLQKKAIDGIHLLAELQEIAKDKLTILAGSGINSENVKYFKKAGLREIHASASALISQKTSMFSAPQTVSSRENIINILKAIKNA